MFIKLKYYCLLSALIILAGKGRAQMDTLKQYNEAVKYLSQNTKKIRQEWRAILTKYEKKAYKKSNGKDFKYLLSEQICFYDLIAFSKEAADQKNGIDVPSQLFDDNSFIVPADYDKMYGFTSYRLKLVDCPLCHDENLSSVKKETMVINFSRPVNNYMIAVLSPFQERLRRCNIRMQGRVLLMLFVYNRDATLQDVHFTYEQFE
jgi:hypothetical protein